MANVDALLTGDQRLLRDASDRFAQREYPLTTVREVADSGMPTTEAYISGAAELGWFALLVAPELGGGRMSETPLCDAAVIAEVRGRWLQPLAFVPANVIAYGLAHTNQARGFEDVLSDIIDGRVRATWVGAADGRPAENIWYEVSQGHVQLHGSSDLIQDATSSDVMLVTANGPSGVGQFLIRSDQPGVAITPMHSLDVTRSFGRVALEGVAIEAGQQVGCLGDDAGDRVQRQFDVAVVLTSAEAVGAAGRIFDTAVQYAKDRIAFGRPIGSFQALKHQLADASMLLEGSRAVVATAANSIDLGGAQDAASIAKAFVSDAVIDIAQTCWQVFGGIGYTWEHDQHLYLRRLTTDAFLFGDSSTHRTRIFALRRPKLSLASELSNG